MPMPMDGPTRTHAHCAYCTWWSWCTTINGVGPTRSIANSFHQLVTCFYQLVHLVLPTRSIFFILETNSYHRKLVPFYQLVPSIIKDQLVPSPTRSINSYHAAMLCNEIFQKYTGPGPAICNVATAPDGFFVPSPTRSIANSCHQLVPCRDACSLVPRPAVLALMVADDCWR